MHLARVTVFAGHFGSGKTSLAVAYALWAREQRARVILCDLDIVNPYFRTADAAEALMGADIRLVASPFANTNIDAPALPAATRAIFDDQDNTGIIDLGGDDRGSLALGRYAGFLQNRGGYEMLLVINQYRPLTRNLDDLREMKEEIEAASRVSFTGLVNNSNIMTATTLQDVLDTADFAAEAANRLALPLKMTAIEQRLVPTEGERARAQRILGEIFVLNLYKRPNWQS